MGGMGSRDVGAEVMGNMGEVGQEDTGVWGSWWEGGSEGCGGKGIGGYGGTGDTGTWCQGGTKGVGAKGHGDAEDVRM